MRLRSGNNYFTTLSATLLLLFGLLFPSGSSAKINRDSILKALKNEMPDTVRADAYIQLSVSFGLNDPARSLDFAQQALKLSLKKDLTKKAGQAYSVIGNYFYSRGEFDSAMKYYRLSEEKCNEVGFYFGLGTAVNNIGLVYINLSDYAKGLDYQFRSLKIREKIHDSDGIAFNYNAIAVVYLQKGDRDKALEYQLRSLAIMQSRKNLRGIMTNLSNIGNIYYEIGKYDKSLEYQLRSLKKAEEIKDVAGQANASGNLANIFFKQRLFSKALDYYDRSINFQKEINDKSGMSSNYHSKADVYRMEKDFAKSLYSEKLALELALSTGGIEKLVSAYYGIALSYQALGDNSSAFIYMHKYADLKDSLTSEENKRSIAEMQARFDSESKEKQISLLEQRSHIKELEADHEKNIRNFIVAGLVMVLALALVLFNRYRVKQKANLQLEKAYYLIEEKNKDITASIKYAKRIQDSLLPSEKYLSRILKKLRGE